VERSEYDKLDRAEDRMWWFAAIHRNLLLSTRRVEQRAARAGRECRPILDAGCGTGGFLARLAARYPERTVVGLDADVAACGRAAAKSGRPVCAGSVDALPFSDSSLAAIFSADVLCHRNVDEARALRQFHRCLAEGGWLVLNLPAYRWLLSRHDIAVHNIRRYTQARLSAQLRLAGFCPVYTSYWNAVLFPLMVLTRKLLPGRRGEGSDVHAYARPIEALCRAAMAIEGGLLRAGIRLPFGGSVVAVARKEGTVNG
jgi:SAM-dependent methyltransferase